MLNTQRIGGVQVAALSRAPVNAIDGALIERLDQLLGALSADPQISVLLIRSGLGGGGGRGMGGMFGPTGTGRKYSLNFSVQALNLFNNINYGGPNGVLGSPHFDRSTTLAGGIFSTGSAARRIFGQVVFTF